MQASALPCCGRPAACASAVADSGAGLGESDLQRLGERFFRIVGSGLAVNVDWPS
ncbi:MAG: hypothetical protein Q8L49_07015 [Burkholderiaceae bacterium]|nr:hypothetical protein [Burkholderiaceae bacterium]